MWINTTPRYVNSYKHDAKVCEHYKDNAKVCEWL